MLSTSYEALYALDNLRARANLSKTQLALLIDIDASTYRNSVTKMTNGELIGLNGPIDIKVRYGLAILIHGFKDKKFFPLQVSIDRKDVIAQRKILEELEYEFLPIYESGKVSSDPLWFIRAKRIGSEQSIPTSALIAHASQFTGLAS